MGNLGTVRLLQRRYDEALAAHEAARAIFERLGEPAGVATAWHQIGMVHQEAGQHEAAERAYRQSLGIHVQEHDRPKEAATLGQLGNLYDAMGRLEEAVTFYRQAADIYVALSDQANEGRVRNNIADTLLKLGRADEARREIERAIEVRQLLGHAAQLWVSYAILHNIETAAGSAAAAQAAWRQARDAYLAYRRDGGYAQGGGGMFVSDVVQLLQEDKPEEALGLVAAVAANEEYPRSLRVLAQAVQAVFVGKREKGLAEDSELSYDDAAELLLLLERLA